MRDKDHRGAHSAHATHAALLARLAAFQTELTAQSRSRAILEAPGPTRDMAVRLIAQMRRLMGRAVEAQGLPRIGTGRPVSFSELSLAFAQARAAFESFGRRMGYDRPVADAEQQRHLAEARRKYIRQMNNRIIEGIRSGFLVPTGDDDVYEKIALSKQFKELVARMEQIARR